MPPTPDHNTHRQKKQKSKKKYKSSRYNMTSRLVDSEQNAIVVLQQQWPFCFCESGCLCCIDKKQKSSTSKNLKYQDISYHNNTRIHDSCYYEIKIVSAAVVVISHRCTNRKMFPDTKKQWAGEMMQAAVKLKLLLCCAFRNSSIFRAIMLYGWKFYVPYPAYIAYKKTKKIK